MSTGVAAGPGRPGSQSLEDAFWKALSNAHRRRILDELAAGPKTTGEPSETFTDLSRFAVMQHLDVLTDAGIAILELRGRHRYNHANAAPLLPFYHRWLPPYA